MKKKLIIAVMCGALLLAFGLVLYASNNDEENLQHSSETETLFYGHGSFTMRLGLRSPNPTYAAFIIVSEDEAVCILNPSIAAQDRDLIKELVYQHNLENPDRLHGVLICACDESELHMTFGLKKYHIMGYVQREQLQWMPCRIELCDYRFGSRVVLLDFARLYTALFIGISMENFVCVFSPYIPPELFEKLSFEKEHAKRMNPELGEGTLVCVCNRDDLPAWWIERLDDATERWRQNLYN